MGNQRTYRSLGAYDEGAPVFGGGPAGPAGAPGPNAVQTVLEIVAIDLRVLNSELLDSILAVGGMADRAYGPHPSQVPESTGVPEPMPGSVEAVGVQIDQYRALNTMLRQQLERLRPLA